MGGRRIIDRVIDTLEQATSTRPVIIANDPGAAGWRPDLRVLTDVEPGLGALGGILTAVETLGPVLCVAWDMPFVPPALLRELAGMLADADVAVPQSSQARHDVEPLCAAYGPACGAAIRRAALRGDKRAVGFHEETGIRVARLPERRVLQYGEAEVIFFNVNTPQDLQHAESLCRDPGSSR